MKRGDIVRLARNRHPKIADIEYRYLGKADPDNLTSINKGVALRPATNPSNSNRYEKGDVINKKDEDLDLIREA